MDNFNNSGKEDFDFLKVRDFGELLGTPFYFLRQEFKPVSRILIKFAGPVLAVFLLIASLYSRQLSDVFGSSPSNFFGEIFLLFFVGGLIFGITVFFITVIVVSYISLYVQNGRSSFSDIDVWNLSKYNFFRLFGAGFLTGLLVGVGFIFLYLPGIYMAVALSFAYIAIVHEDLNASKGLGRSLDVIKSNWWFTFGVYIVFGLILIFVIYLSMFIFSALILGTLGMLFDKFTFIAVAVGSVFMFFFYIYFTILQQTLSASLYFNFVSKKEGINIHKRIEQIYIEEPEKPLIFEVQNNEENQNKITENNNVDESFKEEKSKPKDDNSNRFLYDDESKDRFKY